MPALLTMQKIVLTASITKPVEIGAHIAKQIKTIIDRHGPGLGVKTEAAAISERDNFTNYCRSVLGEKKGMYR